ncbi:unnamed protein product [Linum trigynum]|uniref:Uncharacterized protein n=1 Tax=Linum trigynum TaxID=586398 RepID=A0AAV2D5B0_9ROSI
MTESHHIVEIPVDNEEQRQLLVVATAIQNHPLTEISCSPGHLLLLKLWQREEELSGRRIAAKESRLDSIKREIFQLCSFFLIFHGLFFTILFTSSSSGEGKCGKWWVPGVVSLCTSLVFVWLVQVQLYRYWKVWKRVGRERCDGRAVARCIQELRMKGGSFELGKDPYCTGGKKMKSSSVEIKWKPVNWVSQNSVVIGLLCFAGLAVLASRLVLCGGF